MKHISLIINAVLLVAVGFLYYKVYRGSNSDLAAATHVSGKAAEAKIVFVDSDSLMEHYDYFTSMKERMEKKRDSIDRMLTGRGQSLEREISEYQEKAASMSDFERQTREESLTRKQQDLLASRDQILDQLKKEENDFTDSIHNHLVGFLREFNKDKGYDFILGYQRGGGILLASDSLDVTKQVVKGLNTIK